MPTSEAKKRANWRYMSKAYDQLNVRVRKDLDLLHRIDVVATSLDTSRAAYVQEAILARLERDEQSLDLEAPDLTTDTEEEE